MSIRPSDILQGFKRWGARAVVDGIQVRLTDMPTRTLSALRGRSTCAIAVRDLPPTAGDPAQVDIILDGYKATRFFTGYTSDRSATAATMERTANLVDMLSLDAAIGTEITWSSTSFPDAVTALLAAAGIAATEIDSIYDPGSDYDLGPVYPIVLAANENVRQAFDDLMAFGGTAAFITPSGLVRVVDSPGIPASSSATVYAAGASGTEFGIFDAGWQIEGDEGVVSVFTATGPKRPDGAAPDGTFTATGISGRADGKSYRYAQTDATCEAIAERELKRRARAKINAWFTAPLNPNLLPGDTVMLRVDRLGLTEDEPAFVMEVATDAEAGMRVVVSLNPSLVDGYSTSTPPPIADFSMTVEHQLVTLAGVPVASYLVQCQDQSRDTVGGTITALSWTASGTGASPTSSSDPAPVFLFTDLDGAEISLTATSSSGEEASITRTPVANTVQVLTRVIQVAGGSDGWNVLATLGGWRSFTGAGADCTAVPPINESGPLWAGFANGKIYKTIDNLATTPTLVATLSGSIGSLFVNESNEDDVLAAHGASLSRTTNGGTTWTLVKTFADTITDCQSSPSTPGELRVCSGSSEWLSFDNGVTWSEAVTSATADAMMLATAPWGRAVAFSDGAVEFEEGYAVTWTPSQPASLSSITPLLDEQSFIAATCADLIRDGELSSLVYTAGAGTLYKIAWNGSNFDGFVMTPAAAAGPGKLVNQLSAYPIGAFSAAQIGYGAIGKPKAPCEALILTYGVAGGGVWHATAAGWVLKGTGLPSGWYWRQIQTKPSNPDHWLILGDNGSIQRSGGYLVSGGQPLLWHTTNAGVSWSGVPIADFNDSSAGSVVDLPSSTVPRIGYASNGDLFAHFGAGTDKFIGFWRGSTSGLTVFYSELNPPTPRRFPGCVIAGADGDLVFTLSRGSVGTDPGSKFGYFDTGGTMVRKTNITSFNVGGSYAGLLRVINTRTVIREAWWKFSDYRTSAESVRGGTGRFGCVVSGYVFSVPSSSRRIYQIDISGATPTTLTESVIAPTNVLCLRSDEQTQTLMAGILETSGDVYWSNNAGATWQSFAGPPVTSGQYNPDTIAVVVRP